MPSLPLLSSSDGTLGVDLVYSGSFATAVVCTNLRDAPYTLTAYRKDGAVFRATIAPGTNAQSTALPKNWLGVIVAANGETVIDGRHEVG